MQEFGADSLRVYEMFMGPLEQVKPGRPRAARGRRFLDRVHSIASRELSAARMQPETAKLVHRTVKKVGRTSSAALQHRRGAP